MNNISDHEKTTPESTSEPVVKAVIIGAGPAGLMAAEQIANAGFSVDVYDAMPSVARKFLLAGIGGMNITHSEPFKDFVLRYREASDWLKPMLSDFSADDLREWIHALGVETFIGTSGRVFPKEMKAAPMLRKWKSRLVNSGVAFHPRHRWTGWS
ncbi:MAG: NAD(P)/FAD-dependent oxidoreductase, partial [Thalassolituus sp.]